MTAKRSGHDGVTIGGSGRPVGPASARTTPDPHVLRKGVDAGAGIWVHSGAGIRLPPGPA